MSFSPQINVWSAYNFQESLVTIDDYLAFARHNAFRYTFYCDREVMFGAAEFFAKFQAAGIKPILGLGIQLDHAYIQLFAKNYEGYQTLIFLASEFNTKQLSAEEKETLVLEKLDENLIFVGTFDKNFPHEKVQAFQQLVSPEDFYFGDNLVDSATAGTKILNTNKIAYLHDEDFLAYNINLLIKNNEKFTNQDNFFSATYLADEKLPHAKQNQKLLDEINDKVTFNLFEHNTQHLMKFKTPRNLPQDVFLEELTRQSLNSYFNHYHLDQAKYPEYQARLAYELKIINEMNFTNYFLVVWDYVKFAKDQGIMVGPGRGSAAGSLVAFLLKITEVDPLQYNLLFERFLNPERKTMPDIDIDFQDDRREEVLEYLFEKYGIYHVATIVTYQTIGAKNALRDTFRAFDKSVDTVNKITKLIPSAYQLNLPGAIKASKALQAYEENNRELFQVAEKFIGLPRQTGTHAAGVVLCDVDLRTVVPIRVGYNGIMQTQYDMNYLESLGLIKMDLLGLRNLSTLQEIRQAIFQSTGKTIQYQQIPLNDLKVYDLLNQGKTTGIFQLESPGMTDLVVKMQVKNIEDISAASALFRPGPKEMIPEYLKRRHSRQNIKQYILDPSLIDILSSTYGIVLYQEQVIEVLQRVAGFSLGKADIVRRAMSKKDFSKMVLIKQDFFKAAVSRGYNQEKAQAIWHWIEDFAGYGFNKSHSIAYSYISYWLAYLKTYFPEQFYAAMFNASFGNASKMKTLMKEIRNYGIDFQGPNIKNVNAKFVAYNQRIYTPLTIIKGIGPEFLKTLKKVYLEDKTKFDNFYTLMIVLVANGLNAGTYESLVWAGAFDTYGFSRQDLIDNEQIIFNFAQVNAKVDEVDLDRVPLIGKTKVVDEQVLAQKELETLGFYLTTNPYSKWRQQNKDLNLNTLEEVVNKLGTGTVIVTVKDLRTKKDKNGKLMAFGQISDETMNINATIFASVYEEVKDKLVDNSLVAVQVKLDVYQGQAKALINRVIRYLN